MDTPGAYWRVGGELWHCHPMTELLPAVLVLAGLLVGALTEGATHGRVCAFCGRFTMRPRTLVSWTAHRVRYTCQRCGRDRVAAGLAEEAQR